MLFSFRPGAGERIPRIGSLEIPGPVHADRRERDAEPSRASSSAGRRPQARAPVRDEDPLDAGAARVRRPVTEADLERRWPSTERPRGRGLRRRHSGRAAGHSREPEVPVSRRARRPALAAGTVHRITTSTSRRACRSSCSASARTTSCWRWPRKARWPTRRARRAGQRLLADPRASSLVTNFAFQWLKMRGARRHRSDAGSFPNFDDGLREAFGRELELFVDSIFREDRSVLDLLTRRLHLRERAPRAALRHSERARRSVPPRDADRSESLGPARQGRRAAGHLVCQPHGAGAARRVDSREHPRHAAGGAAADVEAFPRTRTARRPRPVREIMEQHRASRRATPATA